MRPARVGQEQELDEELRRYYFAEESKFNKRQTHGEIRIKIACISGLGCSISHRKKRTEGNRRAYLFGLIAGEGAGRRPDKGRPLCPIVAGGREWSGGGKQGSGRSGPTCGLEPEARSFFLSVIFFENTEESCIFVLRRKKSLNYNAGC